MKKYKIFWTILLTSKATCGPKKSWHSTSVMYNISGKTGFDQARYTNKNSGSTQSCTSQKGPSQIEIYTASKLADLWAQWRGKPSVLLADAQSRHATQTRTSSNHCKGNVTSLTFTSATKTLKDACATVRMMFYTVFISLIKEMLSKGQNNSLDYKMLFRD